MNGGCGSSGAGDADGQGMGGKTVIRSPRDEDRAEWAYLRWAPHSGGHYGRPARQVEEMPRDDSQAALVAERPGGGPDGFPEA
jgi:hypothetical protein